MGGSAEIRTLFGYVNPYELLDDPLQCQVQSTSSTKTSWCRAGTQLFQYLEAISYSELPKIGYMKVDLMLMLAGHVSRCSRSESEQTDKRHGMTKIARNLRLQIALTVLMTCSITYHIECY